MLNFLQKIGHKTLGRFAALGRSANMLFGALVHIPNFKKGTPLLIRQLYMVGSAIVAHYCGVGVVYWHGISAARLYSVGWLWCRG